jgi:hypothetical protein
MLHGSGAGRLPGSGPGRVSGSGSCDFVSGSGSCGFVSGSGSCDFVSGPGSCDFVSGSGSCDFGSGSGPCYYVPVVSVEMLRQDVGFQKHRFTATSNRGENVPVHLVVVPLMLSSPAL